ncbi:MAG: 4-hydroxy-3-methylbut-2-enyl diphosphate reductase [Candidatus Omnitrophica bacterium]|nr:4-hydroxy-3-methylbut-2-enyl diphosphate reductase [Candidatus Omnitrophota bacterium]
MSVQTVILASPRGFCAGVERAIEIVERALARHDRPVYVRKEIVHNQLVIKWLCEKGANFVDELDQVPDGALAIFSAHGVSPAVRETARARHLHVIDATCPLVTKVHNEAKRYAREGYTLLLVGHSGHEEVEGTMGEAPQHTILIQNEDDARFINVPNPERVAVITQTTLSIDDTQAIVGILKERFPALVVPKKDDICYATQNRQNAVKLMAQRAQLVLVVGSKNSSNSIRLTEVAKSLGCESYLINDAGEVDPSWFEKVECVGVTSGASAPEQPVQELLDYLKKMGARKIEILEYVKEDVDFAIPAELQ